MAAEAYLAGVPALVCLGEQVLEALDGRQQAVLLLHPRLPDLLHLDVVAVTSQQRLLRQRQHLLALLAHLLQQRLQSKVSNNLMLFYIHGDSLKLKNGGFYAFTNKMIRICRHKEDIMLQLGPRSCKSLCRCAVLAGWCRYLHSRLVSVLVAGQQPVPRRLVVNASTQLVQHTVHLVSLACQRHQPLTQTHTCTWLKYSLTSKSTSSRAGPQRVSCSSVLTEVVVVVALEGVDLAAVLGDQVAHLLLVLLRQPLRRRLLAPLPLLLDPLLHTATQQHYLLHCFVNLLRGPACRSHAALTLSSWTCLS